MEPNEGKEIPPNLQKAQARLDSLDMLEDNLGQPGATQEPQPAQPLNQVNEIASALYTAGVILTPKYPRLGQVYTQERCLQVAQALDPVFADLGWNISDARWMKYAGALFAVVSLGSDTVKAIKADRETQEAAAAQAAAEAVNRARGGDNLSNPDADQDH